MSDFVFSGLKVIDCATVIAAPVAAMILADFGADVIKIEPPGGDMLRRIPRRSRHSSRGRGLHVADGTDATNEG